MFVGNGYGKLIGVTQVRELGELETPILLTCTLCVWKAADAMVGWMLDREGMEGVRSLNAVVGETNDGGLNDIRARPITPEDVVAALEGATAGEVEEGSVGAGTGTRAFGWKGGIGTSSRVLPDQYGGYTVGVLVQSNFGGILTMDGAPVGEELGRYSFRGVVEGGDGEVEEVDPNDVDVGDGSIMMVVATDAPLSDRNLERLAARAVMGLARTGSFAGNGSGDYVIAFSTAEEVRRGRDGAVRRARELRHVAALPGGGGVDRGGDLQLAPQGDDGHGRPWQHGGCTADRRDGRGARTVRSHRALTRPGRRVSRPRGRGSSGGRRVRPRPVPAFGTE